MSRYLIVDIGAGTMDVLYYDDDSGLHYKAVVKSPVPYIAEKASMISGNLLVTGREMGGGALSEILRQRAQEAEVLMTRSSAMTIHHDPERVRSWGIKVIEDSEAEAMRENPAYGALTTGDLDLERLKGIVEGFGVPFAFDVVGVCAQDHGTPPAGVTHLDYRHNIFKDYLDQNPFPQALLFKGDAVPKIFNRLKSIAEDAKALSAGEVYVIDSGMAAILGASLDLEANRKERVVVLDIATSHTVAAALDRGEIAGFFEYHTRDITLERLESLLRELADGKLEHARILEEGGHGAYIRKAVGFSAVELIVATGPKRRLVANASLSIRFGAPWGDNMMTGTVGILEAIRRRKGLKPILYL